MKVCFALAGPEGSIQSVTLTRLLMTGSNTCGSVVTQNLYTENNHGKSTTIFLSSLTEPHNPVEILYCDKCQEGFSEIAFGLF